MAVSGSALAVVHDRVGLDVAGPAASAGSAKARAGQRVDLVLR